MLKIYEKFKGFENCGDYDLFVKIARIFYSNLKNTQEADEVFEQLIELILPISQENKDYNRLGICYQDLSIIKRLQGNYESSFDYIVKSVECFTKYGEPVRTAKALNSLGNFYLDTGELNYALENYHKAFENIKILNEYDVYYIIKANLANIYLTLNYFNKAKQLYIEDLVPLRESNLYEHYAKCLSGLHEIYKEEKRYRLAYRYIKLSIENYTKTTDFIGLASSVFHLASLYG